MSDLLKRTPFYDFHVSAGAKLVDFAGWEMPLLYKGIVEEHVHTRTSGSIFDVSHMGRLRIGGKDAVAFLDRVLTRNVSAQLVGVSRYSLVCNESGGVLDDVIVSHDNKDWLVVCNASNREKIVGHFNRVITSQNYSATLDDVTEKTAMVAIQGPKVMDKLAPVLPVDIKGLKRYGFETGDYILVRFTVFRSGYTGEDGIEMILPARAAAMGMKLLARDMDKPTSTLRPAGLGARDTLRLEAAMPLYGHELGEASDPLSAGLGWAVDLNKDFIGVDALRVVSKNGPARKVVGLELEGRRIARQGTPITTAGKIIGEVTSGTFSPTLQKSIAMAYVDAGHAGEETELVADLKGTPNACKVVKLPFYKRPS
jgi:aminomethyltransferase